MQRVNTESTIEQSTDGSTIHPSSEGGPAGPGFGDDLDRTPFQPTLPLPLLGPLLGPHVDSSDLCNWSEAAARHSEVSSLLESALGTEDGE